MPEVETGTETGIETEVGEEVGVDVVARPKLMAVPVVERERVLMVALVKLKTQPKQLEEDRKCAASLQLSEFEWLVAGISSRRNSTGLENWRAVRHLRHHRVRFQREVAVRAHAIPSRC